VSRAKDLETAVRKYLDLKGCKYISSKNQTVKCYKCNAYQQVRTQGFDFLVFWPEVHFIEVKTGAGKLSPAQKEYRAAADKVGIPYTVVHDTIDVLLDKV